MSNQQTPQHGYWRSLVELDATTSPEDRVYNEFAKDPTAETNQDLVSRRNFFQLMGASMALAGVAGCKRYEKDHIAPLARRPEGQVPGETRQYASMMELAGVAQPLLVTSFEGRPIKVDGNPEHPFTGGPALRGSTRHGGSTAFAQASVLNLYDPDRSQHPAQNGKATTLEAFTAWVDSARGQHTLEPQSVAVLSEATSSPTVARMRGELTKAIPGLAWHEWEPVSWDNEREGTRMAFGQALRPIAKLDKCRTILALDCDLFVEHPAALRYNRDFAKSRRPSGSLGGFEMNRLWSVESTFTSTGAMADHRLPLRSELVLPLAMELDASLRSGAAPSAEFLREPKVAQFVSVLVEELKANRGQCVVVAGRRQPPQVHALVARINETLGAVGTTLDYVEDPDLARASHLESLTSLTKKMAAGTIKTLFIFGGNPVYDTPYDLGFEAALAKVATSVHLSEYVNETSAKATWHVPRAHYLETWSDARTWDGTLTIGQPLLAPLYGGLSVAELLALLAGQPALGRDLVQATHRELGVTTTWEQTVHDGFVASVVPAAVATNAEVPNLSLTPSQLSGTRRKNGELEVVFAPSTQTYDGRFANNAWLQETPDFLTKITWDNYALVSPATATDLGLENDTLIKVTIGERSMDLACYVMPGQAKYSIGLVLGGGRTNAGRVGGDGKKRVGFNTYQVRGSNGLEIATACTVAKTGEEFVLANVQEHWDIRGRFSALGQGKLTEEGIAERIPQIVREAKHDDIVADKAWTAQPESPYTEDERRGLALYVEHKYPGHRWGMSIDLGNCTGCNSCMVACQAENNVPVVGKDQVMKNREMHWIRIDRYFKGSPDEPEIVHQPLGCQQCENAPCEQVCPVGATTHSDEGLNDMAYNRCVGTRYCLNNCPYRVRRFNFLDYHKEFAEARNRVRKLLFNPDVTVRARGVMEKCTFCVQRIQNGKIRHKALVRSGQLASETLPPVEGQTQIEYKIPDGQIVTACQAACPTEAIVFGDLADPDSLVSQLQRDRRSYDLLDELYTKPRNRYLARVRNPNPKLVAPATSHEGGH
ncbi:MAG: TAT-variant-translocated molybdopterin oxidoreductase [Kofleriaceae bacterium]